MTNVALHIARILLNLFAISLLLHGVALLTLAPPFLALRFGGCAEIAAAWALARVRIPWTLPAAIATEQPNTR